MSSSLVGTKLMKNNLNPREYIDLVVTCNKSGSCHIEDKGSYYEVIENEEIKKIDPVTLESLQKEISNLREVNDILSDAINFILMDQETFEDEELEEEEEDNNKEEDYDTE